MSQPPTTLERLAEELAALTRDVDTLRGHVARLYGHAEQLGLQLRAASEQSIAITSAVGSLREEIVHELHRTRSLRNVLFVVDDDAPSRQLAADALATAGFSVRAFSRADEA